MPDVAREVKVTNTMVSKRRNAEVKCSSKYSPSQHNVGCELGGAIPSTFIGISKVIYDRSIEHNHTCAGTLCQLGLNDLVKISHPSVTPTNLAIFQKKIETILVEF